MTNASGHSLTIAYDAKRAYLNYRGLGNYCRNLLAQMSRYYGNNHYVLCTPRDENLYPWLNETPFERVMPQGVWQVAPSLWRRFGIRASLQDKHVDIYHGLSQELPVGIERTGCKTVVTMHDAIFVRYPELYSPTYRYSFMRRNRSACERADRIVAISEQTKRDFIEFFHADEQRIRVVYQGCNDIYWQPVSSEKKKEVTALYQLPKAYILSVGALEERKNLIRLIKAVKEAQTDLPLVLVGRGNEQHIRMLYATAKQCGVSLRLITNVRTEDLPAIYHQAIVFVYPSLFEGFGIPILEAARCQAPIITSSGTCFEEIAGAGALYVTPTDEQAIGDAIRSTLSDSKAATIRVQTALAQTEKFRAERIAQNMMQVYQDLLSDR